MQMPVAASGPGRRLVVQPPAVEARVDLPAEQLRRLLAVLRRRWMTFAGVFLLLMALATVLILRLPPRFAATSTLLVNSRVLNVQAKADDIVPVGSAEDAAVNSEIQIVQSADVGWRVIAQAQAAFAGFPVGLTEAPAPQGPRAILDALRSRTRVDRPGSTNVLGVTVTAADPRLAAFLANAYAQQYLAVKTGNRLDAARTADGSLRRELDVLRGRVEQAEAGVARYRRSHNLLSADGVTLTEQEQSVYKQQEAAAQTQLAEEHARLNTARSQLRRGSTGGDVGEALSSSVVNQLRGQRAAASAKLAQLDARYTPAHPEVIRARRELADIDGEIQGEIGRVMSNLEARVQVAQQRAGSASGIAGASRGELATNAAASVALNELERRADALRTNYAGLLQRQTAVASQAIVADSDARLLSAALVPERPSAPNRKLDLLLAACLAALLASGAVAAVHFFDQTIVSSRQLERALNVRHVVNVPSVASIAPRADREARPINFVVDQPLSMLTESMRSLLLSIDRAGAAADMQVVGITSARAGEGKSTIAACLARVAAISGRRTLLIDGDIRRPSIAKTFGFAPTSGLVEVLAEQARLKETVWRDERSGAWILPSLTQPYEHRHINSEANLQTLMRQLAEVFDLVIIDTAPSLAAVESRLLMNFVDQTYMVVRWNHTPIPLIRSAIARLASIGIAPTGVIMSQVDMRAVAAYAVDDVDYEYQSYGTGR